MKGENIKILIWKREEQSTEGYETKLTERQAKEDWLGNKSSETDDSVNRSITEKAYILIKKHFGEICLQGGRIKSEDGKILINREEIGSVE